jgi:hypothetical protein
MLWSIDAGGDDVVARLTNRGASPLSVIRFRLDPGLLLRSGSVPSWTEARIVQSPRESELTIPLQPAIESGQTVSFRFWRPLPQRDAEAEGEGQTRQFPRIEAIDLARHVGFVGAVVPRTFQGSLASEPGRGIEATRFRESWSTEIPADAMLLGAAKFDRLPQLTARLSSPFGPMIVRPRLRATLERGRIRWDLSVRGDELRDRAGRMVIGIPTECSVQTVSGDQITRWNRDEHRELCIEFEPSETPARFVRVVGTIPIAFEAARAIAQQGSISRIWPEFSNRQIESGELVLESSPGGRIEPSAEPGLVRISGPEANPDEPTLVETRYRADRTCGLEWSLDPPSIELQIHSHLSVGNERATLDVDLRSRAAQGPVRSVSFRIPSDWITEFRTDSGTIDVRDSTISGESSSTVRTATFDPPLFGQRQIWIHGERQLPTPGAAIDFPDIQPLGRGRRSVALSWQDVGGGSRSPGRVMGVRALPPPDMPRNDVATSSLEATNAWQVIDDAWSIRIEAARPAPRHRVSLADSTCVLGGDGAIWGTTRLALESAQGGALPWILPSGVDVLGVRADGRPSAASRDRADAITVDVPKNTARLELLWRRPLEAANQSDSIRLPVPIAEIERWVVEAVAPARTSVELSGRPASMTEVELGRDRAESKPATPPAFGLPLYGRSWFAMGDSADMPRVSWRSTTKPSVLETGDWPGWFLPVLGVVAIVTVVAATIPRWFRKVVSPLGWIATAACVLGGFNGYGFAVAAILWFGYAKARGDDRRSRRAREATPPTASTVLQV